VKKGKLNTQTKIILHYSSSTFYRVQLKSAFRIRPLESPSYSDNRRKKVWKNS